MHTSEQRQGSIHGQQPGPPYGDHVSAFNQARHFSCRPTLHNSSNSKNTERHDRVAPQVRHLQLAGAPFLSMSLA